MYSIQVIATESGIKPETLRKWEQRYGFPLPVRAPNGYRVYSEQDLTRLKKARELIDRGYKPSSIFKDNLLFEEQVSNTESYKTSDEVRQIYQLAKSHHADEAFNLLKDYRSSLGTFPFVEQICSPLVELMGIGWQSGDLTVFSEHLLSEQIQALFPVGQRTSYPQNAPLAIMVTLSNELHTLGLKLANAVLNDAGCRTIYLGGNLPVSEIIEACSAYNADYIGLSLSTKTSKKVVTEQLASLAKAVPEPTRILVGGHGSSYLTELPDNVQILSTFAQLYELNLLPEQT